MNIHEAKQYILEHCDSYFKPAKRKGYVCPICQSGEGKKGTGITKKDATHYTCWTGCYTNADIFEIVGKQHNLPDFTQQLNFLCSYFNILLNNEQTTHRTYNTQERRVGPNRSELHTGQNLTKPDFTAFFTEANKHLADTTYHRGISIETLNRFNVGYVANWKNPELPHTPPSNRLIIPTSKYSYVARATEQQDERYRILKTKHTHIFNLQALTTATQPIFVVEGEIDALSILDLGFEAIGLGGLSAIPKLQEEIHKVKPKQPVIIALDADREGEKASIRLNEQKDTLPAYLHFTHPKTLYLGQKDASEALNANKQGFKDQLQATIAKAKQEADKLETEAKETYRQQNAVSAYMDNFLTLIQSRNTQELHTGFHSIDNLLDGGLYAGLYICGAVSGNGKTTLTLQIADNLAHAGQDVLIFSLEMAKEELIAKSISRLTCLIDTEELATSVHASTTRSILNGAKYNTYSKTQRDLILKGIYRYKTEYADHIFIKEGVGNVGTEQIKQAVAEFMQIYKKAPVIIVDYLQILAPADPRGTDKQNMDKSVLELKRLSRDYNTPVIGISSYNRANYLEPVNLASGKDSGNLEYTADVLLGLQFKGMDYEAGETEKERLKRIRELNETNTLKARRGEPVQMELKVLKNRNGRKGTTVLNFHPMFNYFTDTEPEETDDTNLTSYDLYGKD